MLKPKIVIIDDDPDLLIVLSIFLEKEGYEVYTAPDGNEGIALCRTIIPDLAIIDLMMPGIDGIQITKSLREDRLTYLIPIIILTAADTQFHKISGLKAGADDFITKPFDFSELHIRMKGILNRSFHSKASNPLTGLPGNMVIGTEILKRLNKNQKFAVCYIDLSCFKYYNDYYGFEKGDEVIKFLAKILLETIEKYGNSNDFLGHIGGDDFILITHTEKIDKICTEIISKFDSGIGSLYKPEDYEKGHIEILNRQKQLQKFPLMTLSIGVATNEARHFENPLELSETVTELKNYAKTLGKSTFVVDRRKE